MTVEDLTTLVPLQLQDKTIEWACTYGNCGVSDKYGIQVQDKDNTHWCGAFLCAAHARELNLLW